MRDDRVEGKDVPDVREMLWIEKREKIVVPATII